MWNYYVFFETRKYGCIWYWLSCYHMLILPGKDFVLFHYMFVEKLVSSVSFQQTGLMPRELLLVATLSLFIPNGKIYDYQVGMCNLKGKFLEKHVCSSVFVVLPYSWQLHFHSLCCCYWVFPTIKKYPYVYQLQSWKPFCLWDMAIWDNLL